MPVARWSTSCQMLHIAARNFFFPTGNSAIAVGQCHEQIHCQSGILWRSKRVNLGARRDKLRNLKPRHMQRLLSQSAKWMRHRINSIAQRCCCLVFIASIGSYEKKEKEGSEGLDEPICAERTNLQHRTECPRVLRTHGRMMDRLRTGVAWLGTQLFDKLECGSPTT